MAETLLQREATAREVAPIVHSAGFVTENRAAEPAAVTVMADRGLGLDEHRSGLVTPDLLRSADLVLGMTREHVRLASNLGGDGFAKTFTLKELVRRGTAVGPVADGDLATWLEHIDEDRVVTDLLGSDRADDIADPMGRSLRRFRSCADEIEEQVTRLADLLWPDPGP